VEIKCQLDATEVFIADVEQAIRSAIKTSVASSWHFISTYERRCMVKITSKVIDFRHLSSRDM